MKRRTPQKAGGLFPLFVEKTYHCCKKGSMSMPRKSREGVTRLARVLAIKLPNIHRGLPPSKVEQS